MIMKESHCIETRNCRMNPVSDHWFAIDPFSASIDPFAPMAKLSTKEKQRLRDIKEKEQPVPIPEQFSKASVITPRMMASFLKIGLREVLHALIEIQGPSEPEQILHKTAIRGLCKRYGTHLPWGEPVYSESTGVEDQDSYEQIEKPELTVETFAEYLDMQTPRLRLLIKNRCKKTFENAEIIPDGVVKRICAHLGKRSPRGM